ncbi:hypothetical protein KEM52_000660, partial [Ascosphaera acerosa]
GGRSRGGEGFPPATAPDPLATLPSSPPQIYLNLLILEASLRAQYLSLRARRRQNSFFIFLLCLWIAWTSYALFLRPREDGSGVGGSVYWVVETAEKVALLGGIITAILIWGTGQWERGIRWPRKWLVVANRGLRTMNCKVVVMRGPWWREVLAFLTFLFPFSTLLESLHDGSFFGSGNGSGSSPDAYKPSSHPLHGHFQSASASASASSAPTSASAYGDSRHEPRSTPRRSLRASQEPEESSWFTSSGAAASLADEDLSPGGDHIKLLLLPKYFSPAFRDNWDRYRTAYWEQENERRAQLRRQLVERAKQRRKARGSWLYRLATRVGLTRPSSAAAAAQDDASRPATDAAVLAVCPVWPAPEHTTEPFAGYIYDLGHRSGGITVQQEVVVDTTPDQAKTLVDQQHHWWQHYRHDVHQWVC